MNKTSKVLTEAKQEYTKGLTDILMEPIYNGLKSIYNTARETSKTNNLNTLKTFQTLLSKTPKWSDDKLNNEVSRIKQSSNCDYIDDLVTAVFVSHAKILISIKSKSKTDTIDLNVPKLTFFIHKIYIQCARNFWRQPWLFHTGYNSLDLQRNLIKAENLIEYSILETIRKLLPVKEILQQYLGNNFIDQDFNDYADEDITSTISEKTKMNIKKFLKDELDNNLKTVSETKDFSKIAVSDEVGNSVNTSKLVPENFDSRTLEEPYIENSIEMNNKDTDTQYEEVVNSAGIESDAVYNVDETTTQFEEIIDTNNVNEPAHLDDPEMRYEEVKEELIKKNFKEHHSSDDLISNNESDTDTVIENMSVLKDTKSVETNLVNNFSFFEDAADF